MANTFMPGYMASLTVDGDALDANLASGTMTLNKNIMTKAVAGDQFPSALAGLITGTISCSGHVSTEDVEKLVDAFESNAALTYIWQIGDVTAPDGGAFGGDLLVESLSVAFDVDDEWTFSMDAVLDGEATYTAAT